MTTLEDAPTRDFNKEIADGATFYLDPRDAKYVREGVAYAGNRNYKPKVYRLYGTKPVKVGPHFYKTIIWYLREYDLGMPLEQKDNNGQGYYWWGKNKDGSNKRNLNPTIIPTEGVIFSSVSDTLSETILPDSVSGVIETEVDGK